MAKSKGPLSILYPFLLAAFVLNCHCNEQHRKAHVVCMGDLPKGGGSVALAHHNMLVEALASPSLAKESLLHSYGRSFNRFVARLSDEEVARISAYRHGGNSFSVSQHQTATSHYKIMGFPKSPMVLGNGQIFLGTSINNFHLNGTTFPLVYSGDSGNVTMGVSPEVARLCPPGTLSTLKAKGVVLCDVLYDGSAAIFAVAVGIIMASSFDKVALAFPVPAVVISRDDRSKLLEYIRTAEYPTATILSTETTTDVMAPTVVSFSSRGPNPITPDILKPDITAPDANILSAWSPLAFPSVRMFDDRQVDYYIISGTSMSCPHVTGAAAYNKAAHPTWSPAAIKSALMTTDTIMDPRKNEDAEFGYGSGHINPVKAVDPGLVFDASEADYVDFLCKVALAFPVPVVVISRDDRSKLLEYIRTAEYPTATILSTETTTDVMAPTVVSFSSRGPNPITPDILKPDITAPDANILSAWSPLAFPSVWMFDDRQVDYYIISGTSMSCPHVTGAAAYNKAAHPTWSPAAIKSALMTTDTIMDPRKNEDAEFGYGSGYINPVKVVDPGLVFDASEADYVDFLCKVTTPPY